MQDCDGTRRCAAVGCTRAVGPLYLFCDPHRAALPCPELEALRAACRPGTAGASRPTWEWARAAAVAVELLAAREGRPAANRFRDAIERSMRRDVA